MREIYTQYNKKQYYQVLVISIILMMMGLLIDNKDLAWFGYFLHTAIIIVVSVCLWLYPKYETRFFRIIIMIGFYLYFYTLFFLYPEAWSTFVFLCLIPALSIVFFDRKLFYLSLLISIVSLFVSFSYILFFDQSNLYPYIQEDIVGHVVNFLASQLIIYYIYYLTYGRMKKQQLYYEQIEHSQRLKTTGQFAAAVAHEIRNPLTVVKGFLQLYETDPSISKDVRKHYSLMIDELNSAEQVITHFLSIAKPNMDLQIEMVNVKEVLQSVTDLLHSYGLLHDNKIDFHVEGDSFIAANRMEFKQLMINIIKNAIEASKIGDSVLVKVENKKKFVEVNIIDFGEGMSETEIQSLGTPFYSLKSKGTGLGLMICFHIVEKYNGIMHFQSVKGEGTTATIRFPSKKPS